MKGVWTNMKESIENIKPIETFEVVKCDALNLREKPSKDSNILSVLAVGTVVEKVSNVSSKWMNVKTNDGIVGFAMSDYLAKR